MLQSTDPSSIRRVFVGNSIEAKRTRMYIRDKYFVSVEVLGKLEWADMFFYSHTNIRL